MKKKIILLASFAIIAGSGIVYAISNNSSANSACCADKSNCTGQTCGADCSCGDECTGSGCDCGCDCCK